MMNKRMFTSLLLPLLNGLIGFALVLVLFPAMKSNAAAKKEATPSHSKTQNLGTKAQLGTSFKFSGSTLRGKYNTSMSLNAAVENDKLLEDLLAGRMNFEDRLEQDQNRN